MGIWDSENSGGGVGIPPLPEGYEWSKGAGTELQLWKDGKHLINVSNEALTLLADEGKYGFVNVIVDAEGRDARISWIKPDSGEVHLVFANDELNLWRSWEGGEPSPLLTKREAFAILEGAGNMAATSKRGNPSTISFEIPASVGYRDWEYSISPLSISEMEGGEIRGKAFRVRDEGMIECRQDMYAVSVELILVGSWDASRNVAIGVGVGDPRSLIGTISMPGEKGNAAYISRFISADSGKGDSRDVTLSISAQLVGRSEADPGVAGILAGDMIFPIIYTEEDTPTGILVKDLIFVVRGI